MRLQPGMVVMGGDERICGLTRLLAHGEELRVSVQVGRVGRVPPSHPPILTGLLAPLQFGAIHARCLLTPGHTSGHMSYFLWDDKSLDPPALFSGTQA